MRLGFSRQFYSVRGLRSPERGGSDQLDTGSGFPAERFFLRRDRSRTHLTGPGGTVTKRVFRWSGKARRHGADQRRKNIRTAVGATFSAESGRGRCLGNEVVFERSTTRPTTSNSGDERPHLSSTSPAGGTMHRAAASASPSPRPWRRFLTMRPAAVAGVRFGTRYVRRRCFRRRRLLRPGFGQQQFRQCRAGISPAAVVGGRDQKTARACVLGLAL